MAKRTHSKNKYVGLTVSRGAVRSSGGEVDGNQISLEICPDHVTNLDFSFLSSRPQMQQVFLEFFQLLGNSREVTTKQNYHRYTKDFVRFLDDYEDKNNVTYKKTSDIDGEILLNYRLWLETRASLKKESSNSESGTSDTKNDNRLSSSTVEIGYRSFTFLLKKAKSYHPEWFPKLPDKIPRLGKRNRNWKPVDDVLGVQDLTRILVAARYEIDRTQEQYKQIQEILNKTEQLPVVSIDQDRQPGYWDSLENAVHSLIRENGIVASPPRKVKRALQNLQTSPTELLGNYIPVGESSLLPFALQLYILTALNVSSLVTLTRDCIGNYPLPQYKKLIYDKPRSGASRAKSQVVPAHAPKSKEGMKEDPLQIIEFLLKWTEPLVGIELYDQSHRSTSSSLP
jgi:hypothetical protein